MHRHLTLHPPTQAKARRLLHHATAHVDAGKPINFSSIVKPTTTTRQVAAAAFYLVLKSITAGACARMFGTWGAVYVVFVSPNDRSGERGLQTSPGPQRGQQHVSSFGTLLL
jgi:hypothetical protein